MRSVEFHPEAQGEFISAAQFYEREAEGLGLNFILAVQHTYERLLEFPASGPPFGRRLRRILVPKFPYGLLYRVEPERIYIIAVMHLHPDQATGGPASETALPNHALEQTAGSQPLAAAAHRGRSTRSRGLTGPRKGGQGEVRKAD